MPEKVKPVPEGYHTITPSLVIKDAARAIDFYKKALGAREISRTAAPDGSVMHAELKIGDSNIMLGHEQHEHSAHENCAKEPSELKGTSCTFYLYVENCDNVYKQAVQAGAESLNPLTDMFWGDRVGNVRDPFGYIWSIASRREAVPREEMKKRSKEFFEKPEPAAAR